MQPPLEGEDEQCWQGSGHPLTGFDGHRLRTVGSGLDVECVLMVFFPVGVELVVSLLFLWANQCWKAPFDEIFHAFVFVSCKNNNLPNTCGTRLVVNAYMFKFVNFSPFMS
jgi:hypothetical protein